ncbi:hypothetical protein NHN26_10435 [Rhodovulum tesquicola]|uniref:hypothetical protein n=1 Tax=Rhodovulum tesquicola TaxID=540254 RepID=UPI002097502B|nr:hypothetical protein [Rhodovulum tesquicola]MCO8145643.1 hypothetical protein [Rhodovulum tesquicola]
MSFPVRPPDAQPAKAPLPPVKDVFVSVFIPHSVSEGGVAQVVATLVRAGYDMAQPARVRVAIRETDVRFFYRQDAEAARMLARRLGGVARDFTDSPRKPRPGRLELWVAEGPRTGAAGNGQIDGTR